eukprot:gene5777-11672_t
MIPEFSQQQPAPPVDHLQAKPLLYRTWYFACGISIILYFIVILALELDLSTSENPVCHVNHSYSNWVWSSSFLETGGFVAGSIILCLKLFVYQRSSNSTSCLYSATLCVVSMGLTTSMLNLTRIFVCTDIFGVTTPAAMWAEWIACAPLLMFIAVAIEDKSYLSQYKRLTTRVMITTSEDIEIDQSRRDLARKPFFNILNEDATCSGYQLADITTKLVFIMAAIDIHLDVIHPDSYALVEERRMNETRRACLRYVFHEVRVPLNSMTLGISLLEKSCNLEESDIESLEMMREASHFMSQTLNDVLSMQKIEEGKLELSFLPFCIYDAVYSVYVTFQATCRNKEIQLHMKVAPDVPVFVLGDRFRIEHVLANFLSNAIKFSPENRNIYIEVTSTPKVEVDKIFEINKLTPRSPVREFPHMVEVEFAVRDQGPGISEEDQIKLFQPFMQIRPGELQKGGGTGVGLSLCKQIVEMHGGKVKCESLLGLGSSFIFAIPFIIGKGSRDKEDFPSTTERIMTPVKEMESARSVAVQRSLRSDRTYGQTISNDSAYGNFVIEPIKKASNDNDNMSISSPFDVDEFTCFSDEKHKEKISNLNIHNNSNSNGTSNISVMHSSNKRDSENSISITKHWTRTVSPTSKGKEEMTATAFSTSMTTGDSNSDKPSAPKTIGRVLVVDDVRSNRKLLQLLLTKSNIMVDAAEDGLQAVDMITQSPSKYSLSGLQATAVLRENGFDRIIIGLTGCALEEDISEFIRSGADLVLPKPMNAKHLDIVLRYFAFEGTHSNSDIRYIIDNERVVRKAK